MGLGGARLRRRRRGRRPLRGLRRTCRRGLGGGLGQRPHDGALLGGGDHVQPGAGVEMEAGVSFADEQRLGYALPRMGFADCHLHPSRRMALWNALREASARAAAKAVAKRIWNLWGLTQADSYLKHLEVAKFPSTKEVPTFPDQGFLVAQSLTTRIGRAAVLRAKISDVLTPARTPSERAEIHGARGSLPPTGTSPSHTPNLPTKTIPTKIC